MHNYQCIVDHCFHCGTCMWYQGRLSMGPMKLKHEPSQRWNDSGCTESKSTDTKSTPAKHDQISNSRWPYKQQRSTKKNSDTVKIEIKVGKAKKLLYKVNTIGINENVMLRRPNDIQAHTNIYTYTHTYTRTYMHNCIYIHTHTYLHIYYNINENLCKTMYFCLIQFIYCSEWVSYCIFC